MDMNTLDYLLTLPPMSKIKGMAKNFEFEAFGKRGLYQYKNKEDLTLQELIQLLPDQKYQFEIEFEQEERDVFSEAMTLKRIYERTKNPELLEKLKKLTVNPEMFFKLKKLDILNTEHLKNPQFLFANIETIISKSGRRSVLYAKHILNGRFEKGECAMAKSAWFSSSYAFFLKQRFYKGEKAILKNSFVAMHYALDVIKGRWPEAEPIIAKNEDDSFNYAKYVLKDRFKLGEPKILSSCLKEEYLKFFLKKK